MSKVFALLGYPVKHSYSAIMHNAAFRELGIGARYELLEVEPERLEEKFKEKVTEGVCGFNVTIPHKEQIIKYLDQIDPDANFVGAINTIKVNADKTTKGFNTDGLGFMKHLTDVVGLQLLGKSVSILGAGGAAKAISAQLAKNKVKDIFLFDIDKNKAEALVSKLKADFPHCQTQLVETPEALLQAKPELLINATPLGMHKEDAIAFNPDLLHPQLIVYDLIYNPTETPLLREAKRKACRGVFNGLGMLLYQGVFAFKIWLEIEAPTQAMAEALRARVSS